VSLIESDSLLSKLRISKIGQSLLILEECTSTNDIAAQMANAGAPHGFTVFAEKQTQGRGRHDRTWFSPEGGIRASVVLRPPRSFEPSEGIQLIGALAMVQAISALHKIKTSVRWPNDVMFNNRKLAGALVEARFTGNLLEYAILGLGVNVNFPSSLLTGVA
jgi:BirA family biotin operon repressor/biotin-[acetyl-CoA-carboxylase] ligase